MEAARAGGSLFSLGGKAAIVTGGGAGIGRAIGLALAEAGCDLGLIDLDAAALGEARTVLAATGRRVAVATADVADLSAMSQAVDDLAASLGRLDMLVNCAGILRLGKLEDIDLADWHGTMRTNVDGTLYATRAAVPHLRKAGGGRIVNIASWMGKSGKACFGAYCASKAAIISMTETFALELADDGITVNAICPGIIMQTGMRERAERDQRRHGLPSAEERIDTIPLKRLGQPEDVAGIAVFLGSEAAAYMTGHTVNVTGGMWLK